MRKSLCELSDEYFEALKKNRKIIKKVNRELFAAKEQNNYIAEKEIRAKLAMLYEISRELNTTAVKLRDYYKFSTPSADNKN